MPKLTFRGRLLISHILPVFLLIPLVGLTLIYLLENQLILPIVANEMVNQGILVERLTRDQPNLWISSADAQTLLDSIDFHRPSRIGFLTPDHILLATSRPDDRALVGKTILNLPDASSFADSWWAVTPGDLTVEQILNVLIPVKSADGYTIGLIRIYRGITDIEQSFVTMRLLVLGALLFGLLITGTVAVFLSASVSHPLKIFTQTITQSPLEGHAQHLPEEEGSEFIDLAHAYNRLQERRQELEETRQEMLAGLIHEIGRPLGSLRTALHALQVGAINDPALRTDLMNGMSERIDRMGRLLEDLALTYRGLEPQELHLKPVQINGWLESLTPLWAASAREKKISWELILLSDPIMIQTDPDRLAQVLGNLVSNAIKFTPEGGKVTVRICVADGTIQFQVSDTGIGIPQDVQHHLFVPFYRFIQPSWKAPGLGLGLSIAKSITESLGGQISVRSLPGNGSTFTITFPV
jgi:signal transduction histidine kinase